MTTKSPTLFSSDQLRRLVAETLPSDAKPGEKVVVGTVDQDGVQVMASFKNNAAQAGGLHWELQAEARRDWTGDSSASAQVLLRW